ncbi:HAMP domain-containing sensor histidine kinase [Micromonospora sp. KC213]|uniref:sensor histidine kinase n=1 Tax=Micromonospora sp. KC213 TaxID=2530378 RepID=UPI001052C3ED|nr:HAMP domain-containing sensor histidine kinase [Micromonospora sp. KC213]TDC41562.1 HAMP domain-containing histidine kinase [Micromonospora sp. KC213]
MSVAASLVFGICGTFLLVGVLILLAAGHRQDSAVDRSLSHALRRGDAGHAQSGLWLFVLPGEGCGTPADAPAGFPRRGSMQTVATYGGTLEETVSGNGTVYRVRTERFGTEVRQAVLDERRQRQDRRRWAAGLTGGALATLIVAVSVSAAAARRAIDPVAELLALRRRFVTDASHELRAPLTRLHTRSQLMLRGADDLSEPIASELRRLAASTRELGEVLDDVLRAARLRSGAPERERIDLVPVAAELLAAEAGRLAERGLSAVLWTGAEQHQVLGVRTALRRVLSALVDNAIGHTPAGGRITIRIATVDDGRTVELTVRDTGVGFDPARHPEVFERFARGAGSRGYGIGLALTREVVESHGGTITAAGRPGRGAHLTVRLPAAPPVSDASARRNQRFVRAL